jgi:hypothetical protein
MTQQTKHEVMQLLNIIMRKMRMDARKINYLQFCQVLQICPGHICSDQKENGHWMLDESSVQSIGPFARHLSLLPFACTAQASAASSASPLRTTGEVSAMQGAQPLSTTHILVTCSQRHALVGAQPLCRIHTSSLTSL